MNHAPDQPASVQMLDPQQALGAYLDALLQPAVPETAPAEPGDSAVPVNRAAEDGAASEDGPCGTSHADRAAAREDAAAEESRPRPAWAAEEFRCLMFRVAGLNLAVPLALLDDVLPWQDARCRAVAGQGAALIGLREHRGGELRLVDLAAVVLPAERHAALGPADGRRLGKLLLVGGRRWGLACEAIVEVISLSPASVKWRSHAGTRPWLAGTAIDRSCALLDVEALVGLLEGLSA
ncbi:chemotaxis protein CheW [Thiohalobacter sp. IOR34]|uniref:chemotaxis protein CheW n=1 Tax=Thiohalobacter sp. IOR34 TaxID=3057176 RepID=UPI0025B046F5|nr:chemotaxis protein CheW [Thiohalobacter sp. IOR34]WJW74553.1 chemotaxis protein CheW [Thiohalobacter sp. IOR34]